jgi:hypothetical protein
MSGGHWSYAQFKIEEHIEQTRDAVKAIAKTEHALDWCICGDTGYDTAFTEMWKIWSEFFDKYYGDDSWPTTPIKVKRVAAKDLDLSHDPYVYVVEAGD